ncbi:MAG: hypothetical protein EU536_00660 [Promethearchaeota archaeon]|nr:MAG: hypothetical protein EU536_00660 [Candidatus Lokiarchaeota archaeon]
MCDTLVCLPCSTQDGSLIFGKNSDRDPGEVHAICFIPRAEYDEGATVQCQYLEVPQANRTHAVILAKPAWLKIGCEMGANEFGVMMGNEAVFTKEPYEREALLGMDLMTLTLQRSKTAKEALTVITDLMMKYGQGGVASLKDPNYIYHNSFIIADIHSAWVLETADRFWVAKKVEDVASISNGLTITDKWELASPNLVDHAIQQGWCESKTDFNFSECYSNPDFRVISACEARQQATLAGIKAAKGNLSVETVMNILRLHDKEPFRPDKASMASVCAHYNSKTVSQTTGSYIASLSPDFQVHWLTGTSAPCISLFKPFFFEAPHSLETLAIPSLTNDNTSLWWTHEKLHRLALMDYPTRAPLIIEKTKALEQQFLQSIAEKKSKFLKNGTKNSETLNLLSSTALKQNQTLIEQLTTEISQIEIANPPPKIYLKFWTKLSDIDGLSLN